MVPPISVLSLITAAFDKLGIRYVLVGSFASSILAKLRWYRAGNESATNQWNDVLGILGIMRNGLDVPYLRLWAERLQISDLLERAWEEAKT